jgi:predicted transcriptional regulator
MTDTQRELLVLQAIRLKGRATVDGIGTATRLDSDTITNQLKNLIGASLVVERSNGRLSLGPEGKTHLYELLDDERASLEPSDIELVYARFLPMNNEFKAVVTDWQQRAGQPNDHNDPTYDASVLTRLGAIDEVLHDLLGDIAVMVPRLSTFQHRFAHAIGRIRAGDTKWFVHPQHDSYHTLWFELHEELILLAGRSRDAEAAAGNAS